MKASELRIGNFVVNPIPKPVIHTVDELGNVMAAAVIYDPIPISEECLLKFGFEKRTEYGWKGNGADWQPETSKTEVQEFVYWVENHCFIYRITKWSWRKHEGDQWKTEETNSVHLTAQYYKKVEGEIPRITSLQYVHQLQNIFFAVTGQELTAKQS